MVLVGKKDEMHKCFTCEKVFPSVNSMKNHEMRNHASANMQKYYKNGRYACPLCHSSYKAFGMLRDRHFKIHHENDQELLNQNIDESELTVKCTECDLKFLEERFMRFHKKYKHDSEFGAHFGVQLPQV